MPEITVNGESQSIKSRATITELLDQLELAGKRIAVERNGQIVPKSEHGQTALDDGDQLEIVVAVGGG